MLSFVIFLKQCSSCGARQISEEILTIKWNQIKSHIYMYESTLKPKLSLAEIRAHKLKLWRASAAVQAWKSTTLESKNTCVYKRQKHRGKAAAPSKLRCAYTQWYGRLWVGWQKCVYISSDSSCTSLFFSRVRGQASLKVRYHLARWRSFLSGGLILWVEGYPSLQHPPANPAGPSLMHPCPHILSVLVQNPKGVSTKSLLRGRSVKPSLKEK